MASPDAVRKIIIFTEHRDTLEYLADRIRGLLGRPDAVVTIHGGVRREERRKIMELFTQDVDTRVLVATDAAGEGLNLQRAHLMVNYDLPWNPNRIEQRFGRIHRIGQTEVCHLWNLVAADTREGMVFTQLLLQDRGAAPSAYHGKVFDVLGEAFEGQPLRGPAHRGHPLRRPTRRSRPGCTRSSTPPSARAWTSSSPTGPRTPTCSPSPTWRSGGPGWTRRTRRRLSPHFISELFTDAFRELGGRLSEREPGRYEIRHVPAGDPRPGPPGRHRARPGPGEVRAGHVRQGASPASTGRPRADLLAPGHPLLDAVTDLIIERHGTLLKQGTMLKDEHDPGTEPRLLVAVTHEITDGHQPAHTVAKKFGFVEVDSAGANARRGGAVPRLQTLG